MKDLEVVRVPTAPGSKASPDAPAGHHPSGYDPSRVAPYKDARFSELMGEMDLARSLVWRALFQRHIPINCEIDVAHHLSSIEARARSLKLLFAQAMSAGTAETPKVAQGDSPPARSEGCAHPQPVGSETATDAAKREGEA